MDAFLSSQQPQAESMLALLFYNYDPHTIGLIAEVLAMVGVVALFFIPVTAIRVVAVLCIVFAAALYTLLTIGNFSECRTTTGNLVYQFADESPGATNVKVQQCRDRPIGVKAWDSWFAPTVVK